jgi:hypothetical protein
MAIKQRSIAVFDNTCKITQGPLKRGPCITLGANLYTSYHWLGYCPYEFANLFLLTRFILI